MFVAHILSSIWEKFPDAIIHHYMDDISVHTETVLKQTIQAIEGAGFEIATEKIQHTCPWTYLRLWISKRTIVPQQLTIKDSLRTLRDLHQLCGSINWVCSLLGITTEDLSLLLNLLRGPDDLDSPGTITAAAQVLIQKVSAALSTRQAHCIDPTLPLQFVILGKSPKFHGLIFQQDPTLRDQLLLTEWGFNHTDQMRHHNTSGA